MLSVTMEVIFRMSVVDECLELMQRVRQVTGIEWDGVSAK
jgi:hypothetical protein